MSIFRRGDQQPDTVKYSCPGCNDWHLEVPHSIYWADPAVIDAALNEHREECPPLSAIFARAHARQADRDVPVAPLDFDALHEIEAEITDLAKKAARAGRMHREYVAWHERINELLTWRDTVIDARGAGEPSTFKDLTARGGDAG